MRPLDSEHGSDSQAHTPTLWEKIHGLSASIASTTRSLFSIKSRDNLRRKHRTFAGATEVYESRVMQSATPTSLALDIHQLSQEQSQKNQDLTDIDHNLATAETSLSDAQNHLIDAQALLVQANAQVTVDEAALSRVMPAYTKALTAWQKADAAVINATKKWNDDLKLRDTTKVSLDREKNTLDQLSPEDRRYPSQARKVASIQRAYNAISARIPGKEAAIPPLQLKADRLVPALNTAKKPKEDAEAVLSASTAARDAVQQDIDDTNATILAIQAQIDDITAQKDATIFALQSLEGMRQKKSVEAATLVQEARMASAEIANMVRAALEAEANAIKYAKMEVTYETLFRETRFTVRFRSPLQSTMIYVTGISDPRNEHNVIATEPVRDATHSFKAEQRNDIPGTNIRIRLVNGETQEILQDVYFHYVHADNRVYEMTEQIPFDVEEEGKLAENPITPDLKIGAIVGTNVVVIGQTPHDRFYVTCDEDGLLGSAKTTTTGGSLFTTAAITLNTDHPTGDYTIRMHAGVNGTLLKSIPVHFDKDTKTLTAINPSDMYKASIDNTDAAALAELQEALRSLPIGIDNPDISRIQQMNLYQMTSELSAPYDIYMTNSEMLDIFYNSPQYSKYKTENLQQTIDAEYVARGSVPGTRGKVESDILYERKYYVDLFSNALNDREAVLADCMQNSVNICLGIIQGNPERPLRDQLQKAMDAGYKNKQGAFELLGEIGIGKPTFGTLLIAGKLVFQKHYDFLIKINDDVRQYEQSLINRAEQREYLEKIEGLKQMGSTSEVSEVLDTRQLRLNAKIFNAMMQSSRLQTLYSAADQSTIAAYAAGLAGTLDTAALTTATLEGMGAVELEGLEGDGLGGEGPTTQSEARGYVYNLSQRTLYKTMLNDWYSETDDPLQGALPMNTFTIAGRILGGVAQKLFSATDDQTRWEVAYSAQRITGIPADVLYKTHAINPDRFAAAFQALVTKAQFGHLFSPTVPNNSPSIESAHPDIPASSNASYDGSKANIRIRLDVNTAGKEIRRIEAYFGDKQMAITGSQSFIDVPIRNFGEYFCGENLQLKIKIVFDANDFIEEETDPFNISLSQSYFDAVHGIVTSQTLSDNTIENSILQRVHMPFDPQFGSWTATIGSDFHLDNPAKYNYAFNAFDINLPGTTDRDKPVLAAAKGKISKINPINGTIIIDHEATSASPAWQSKYLHTPLRKTDIIDPSTGNPFYVFDDKDGHEVANLKISEAMSVEALQKIAVIAGRTLTEATDNKNTHLHFEVLHVGKSINLHGLANRIWAMTVTGDDGEDFTIRPELTWHSEISNGSQNGFWKSDAQNLIFFRDQTITDPKQNNYWAKWDGVDITSLKRVKWDFVSGSWIEVTP